MEFNERKGIMYNLTFHYLMQISEFGGFRSKDILLTVRHYGPRGPHTRMGIAAAVRTSTGFVPVV